MLLNNKRLADPNKPNNYDGITSLHYACRGGHIEIVKLLLNDKRIDINKACNEGETSLHYACDHGHFEIVQHILASGRGVNLTIQNNEGMTPIDIARNNKEENEDCEEFSDIIELLESFERDPIETRIRLEIQLGYSSNFFFFFFFKILMPILTLNDFSYISSL